MKVKKLMLVIMFIFIILTGLILNSVTVYQDGNANPIDLLEPGHWLEIPNSHLENVLPSPLPQNWGGSGAIMSAWNGGAYDTKRDRFIIWGGGHRNYSGNEIYSFDIQSLSWQRLTEPSGDVGGDEASGYYPDGNPRARETKNYIQYIPSIDRFMAFGAFSMWPSAQISVRNVDAFNFDTKTWERKAPVPDAGGFTAYDPVTGHVFSHSYANHTYLSEYFPENDTWVPRGDMWSESWMNVYTAAIDPMNRKLVAVGTQGLNEGEILVWDISKAGKLNSSKLMTTGATEITKANCPGFEYDAVNRKFVAWSGGANVYTLDMNTLVWTKVTPSGTNTVIPTNAQPNGTYGRFRYIPSKNAFIAVNATNENVYVYKMSVNTNTPTPTNTPTGTPTSTSTTTPTSTSTNTATNAPINVPTNLPIHTAILKPSPTPMTTNTVNQTAPPTPSTDVLPPLGVTRVSSENGDGIYNIGDVISINLFVSQKVTVYGTPQIIMNTGRKINYSKGSGSNNLKFSYTVDAGDVTADLNYNNTNALLLNGGSIKDESGRALNLTLPPLLSQNSLGGSKNIIVDGIIPKVNSVSSFRSGNALTIKVSFTETVIIQGSLPQMILSKGRTAKYEKGSGTNTLEFKYVLQKGELLSDIDRIAANSMYLNGGTIGDKAGNYAELLLPVIGEDFDLAVESPAPVVSHIGDQNKEKFKPGDKISITVKYEETVNVTGHPAVYLNGGRKASYQGGSGTNSLIFTYIVGEKDTEESLKNLASGALSIRGGEIRTQTGNLKNNNIVVGWSNKTVVVLYIGSPYIEVNGKRMEIDPGRGTKPVIHGKSTFIPLRVVENMGGTVAWNAKNKKVTIKLRGKIIELWMGKKTAQTNGTKKTLDVEPKVMNSRTMMPLRFIVENLGGKVEWIGAEKKIIMYY